MTEKIFPYELPENWQWTTLENVCEYIRAGGDKPEDFSKQKTAQKNIPVVANGMINDGIIGYTSISKEKSGTITVSGRGTIGHTILRNYEYYPVVRLLVLSANKKIIPNYLKHLFDFWSVKGIGSSIPQLTIPMLKKFSIPLPPLDEQKKIVERIESLFSKLDSAKSILQKILDGYELRRSAILHKAFTGELTENFRAENNLSLDDWQAKKLKSLLTTSKEKISDFSNKNLKLVGLENIEKSSGKISFQSAADVKSTKNIFYVGDILYGKLRPYLNKHGIAEFDGICSTDILVFRANELTCNKFVDYFFNLTKFLEYVISNSKGINLPRVSEKIILDYEINLPPLAEQKEIVRVLDSLLDKEQRTKDIAENILQEIDLLKKSILARAFRGKL